MCQVYKIYVYMCENIRQDENESYKSLYIQGVDILGMGAYSKRAIGAARQVVRVVLNEA